MTQRDELVVRAASAFIARTDMPALVKTMLRHAQVTTNITVPVSAGLLHDA